MSTRQLLFRNLLISLVLALGFAWGAKAVVNHYLPPYPQHGVGHLPPPDAFGYWMAGQVNPPGKCGFTIDVFDAKAVELGAVGDVLTVRPDIGSGAPTYTNGGMLSYTPLGVPVGSYVVVYGSLISGGGWCEDEQGRKYKDMFSGTVLLNPAIFPDPALRRTLAEYAMVLTGLLVFGLGALVSRRLARRAAAHA